MWRFTSCPIWPAKWDMHGFAVSSKPLHVPLGRPNGTCKAFAVSANPSHLPFGRPDGTRKIAEPLQVPVDRPRCTYYIYIQIYYTYIVYCIYIYIYIYIFLFPSGAPPSCLYTVFSLPPLGVGTWRKPPGEPTIQFMCDLSSVSCSVCGLSELSLLCAQSSV